MANAAGVSAEEVSNQMTAVWNNFDNGSKSLEYYADVMTALGAATASSTSEIATGLEKFAAVSETVGLSYEYATAALATVTATTRQNADIVGNAFKTLFARIQGLELGETLEDGTNLNKYSEALAAVGISIKDQNDELRSMDDILNEMGAKWGTLDKAQQTALAQTVAGVRQYTQLIALMDNWDFFQENLGVALGSEGTLTKQAEIYAESWEAAEKRVQAAAEAIYQDLLDDEFFIDLTNGVEGFLIVLDKFIDGIGGVKGVLLGLGAIATKVFEKQIASGLNTARYNLQTMTETGRKTILAERANILDQFSNQYVSLKGEGPEARAEAQTLQEELRLQDELAQRIDQMNSLEQLRAKALFEIVQMQGQQVILAEKEVEAKQKSLEQISFQIKEQNADYVLQNEETFDLKGITDGLKGIRAEAEKLGEVEKVLKNIGSSGQMTEDQLKQLEGVFEKLPTALFDSGRDHRKVQLIPNLQEALKDGKDLDIVLSQIHRTLLESSDYDLLGFADKFHVNEKLLHNYRNACIELSEAFKNAGNASQGFGNNVKTFEDTIIKSGTASKDWATNLVNNANKISTVVFSIQSLSNVIDTLKDPDISGWDKFTTALTGISFAIPGLVTGFKSLINVIQAVNAAIAVNNAFTSLSKALQNEENIETKEKIISDILKSKGIDNVTLSQEKYGGATLSAVLAERAQRDTTLEAAAASLVEEGAIKADTASKIKNISITSLLHLKTLLLVAAFAAVGVAIYAVVKAYNADANAAKEAAEAAQKAKDSFEETKSSVEELKSSLSDIDESRKALDNMIKGTDEWREAVENLNDKVLQLIDIYPMLAAAMKNEDGVLSIDRTSEAYEDFLEQQNKAIENTRQTYLSSAMYSNQREDEANITALRQKINNWFNAILDERNYNISGIKTGIAAGANVTVSSQVSNDLLKQVISIIQDTNKSALITPEDFAQALIEHKIDIDDQGVIDALYDNRDSLIQLADSIGSNEKSNEIFSEQAAKSYLQNSGNLSYLGSSNQAVIEKVLGQKLNEVDKSTWATQYKGNYQQDYATKMGYVLVGEKDGEIEYLNNGKSVKVSANEVRWNLNQDKFFGDEEGSTTNKINSLLSGIADADSKALVTAAILGDYKSLTKNQFAMELDEGQSAQDWLKTIFTEEDLTTATEEFGNNFIANVEAVFKASEEAAPEDPFNLSSWEDTFKEIKDLNIGDTIDPEIFNLLDANMQQFFTETEDGTYMLMMAADELKTKLKETLIEDIKTQQGQIDVGQAAMGVYGEDIGESALSNGGTEGSVNIDLLKAQMDFLNSQGVDISKYEEGLFKEGTTEFKDDFGGNLDLINQLAEAAGALKVEFDGLGASVTQEKEKLAMSADTREELNQYVNQGLVTEEQRNESSDYVFKKEVEDQDFDYEEVQNYAEHLRETNKLIKNNIELSEEAALVEKKQIKAVKDLEENFEDYRNTLKTTNKNSEEYAKAVKAIKNNIELLTDTDISEFTEDFITSDETLQALEDISNGVEGAVEKFEAMAAVDRMVKLGFKMDDASLAEFESKIAELQMQEVEIGTHFNNSQAAKDLYDLMMQAGASVNQIQAAFDELGWEPDVSYIEMTLADAARNYSNTDKTVWVPDGLSWKQVTLTDAGASGIEGSTIVRVPVIGKNARKKSIGGAGYTPQPQKQGGGGGGSSRKAPEKKSDIDKERYHTITNQLEDLKSEYEDIAEASDRAFGQDKLDNMDAEIAKTDELISKQKEYLAAIEENLPMDRDIMTAYYDNLIGGPAIEFDEKGNISNFDAIQDAMYARYNANTTALGEEDWEVFEEKYKKLEEYIKQYEETYDLLRDEEQEYQDLINQRLDAQLEKIEYEVDLKLNISDDALEVLEFQLDRLEDDAFKAAETIALQSEKAEKIYDKVQFNQEGIDKILKNHNLNVDAFYEGLYSETELLATGFTENEIETIKEYRDNLLDLNSELLEVRDDVQEKVMETFDAWNEKLQDGIDKFDHYNSVMENYRNIIDIVGKDYLKMNNQMIKALNQAMIDNSINKVKATKDAYDAMTASQASAQAAYEDALRRGTQQDIDYWKETLEQIGVEVSDAQENMMQAWEDALQSAAEAFELAVESAVDNFEKVLLPFGTLDEFSEAYDKQQEVADQYLDDYQKIYELSKLSRDINNSLDDTKIIGGKQKLKDLLEDINDLQEDGVEMSEYDLEYLQKTYDLRMAEIELEQAQRAKDTVRLTRDNEGNWSYAYTADTSAVDDAAQKYEDALYAMQDLSSNYIDEMSEQLISTSQDMEEALAAVRVEDYASIEEYYKKLDEIQQYYLARMKYMQDEMQQALDNNKDLYEQDWKNYSDATGYKISDNEDFMMSYKDTVLGSLFDSEDDIVDFQERVNDALGTEDSGLIGELLQAYEQWSKNTDDAMIAAGSSSEGFAEDMANAVEGEDGILDQSQSATDAVDDMANQMIAGFDSITTAVDVWQSHYSSAMEQVIKDNLDVIDAYNLLLKVLSSGSKQGFVSEDLMNMAASLGNRESSYNENTNSAGSSNASSTRMPARFASGGYTGEWGPDGRWALLDEKEMVLNANDTSNLLSTVSVIQDILRTIDLNAQFATNGLGALTAGFIKDDFNSTLEQNVHIQAEFPNVQDHNEVELALSNLINTASQYANRKE